MFQELGVYGALTNVEEYRLDVIAMDADILSMENHSAFYDINIDEDMTSLYLAAKALIGIQKQFGVIPLIYGKGKCSKVRLVVLYVVCVADQSAIFFYG